MVHDVPGSAPAPDTTHDVEDDFNRANETLTDGADWADNSCCNQMSIDSNQLKSGSEWRQHATYVGTGGDLGSTDQYCGIQLTTESGTHAFASATGCTLRSGGATEGDFYTAQLATTDTGGQFLVSIWDGPNSTADTNTTSCGSVTPDSGDYIVMAVEGGGDATVWSAWVLAARPNDPGSDWTGEFGTPDCTIDASVDPLILYTDVGNHVGVIIDCDTTTPEDCVEATARWDDWFGGDKTDD